MYALKRFVAWDCEGKNNDLWLIQNSEGVELQSDKMANKCKKCPALCIHDCLPYLFTSQGFDVVNIWFRARYDWDSMFKWCTREERLDYAHGSVEIDGYTIRVIPNKIMQIWKGNKTRSYHADTHAFFQCSFIAALKEWKIEIPEIIERGKKERDSFTNWTDSEIKTYNLAECQKLVEMLNIVQNKLISVKELIGGELKSWHGAGAICSVMLNSWNARSRMKVPIEEVKRWTLESYFGGRSELFYRGEYGPIYNYDINSAYPSATRELPDLSTAIWRKVSGDVAKDYTFGLQKVSWSNETSMDERMGPFPFRTSNYQILYPVQGSGTYNLIEIAAAEKKGLWDISRKDAWVIENDYEKPFYEKISNLMKIRLEYKAKKDFAHKVLKLGANAFFGKFAEIVGDGTEKAYGPYNNYLYASFIMAWARSKIMSYMNPDNTILVSTDGIFSLKPLSCPVGEELGEWEFDKYENGKFVLPGIYSLNGKVKSRGYFKDGEFNFPRVYDAVTHGKTFHLTDRLFVGMKKSLKQYRAYPRVGFYDLPKEINWNSSPKRVWEFSQRSIAANRPMIRDMLAHDYKYQESSIAFDPFRNKDDLQKALDEWVDTNEV